MHALADAGLTWREMQFVAGADTMRNGYPGYVSGATFAQALGWSGQQVASCYAACASGATALSVARAQILAGLCDVALVVGADTTPKGFLAPNAGDRPDDPDWLRFRLLGATNPTYFALYAAPANGPVRRYRTRLRKGESEERASRTAQPERPLPQGGHRGRGARLAGRRRLRCTCSTSARRPTAALLWSSHRWSSPGVTEARPPCGYVAISTVTPAFPNTIIEMPNFATDSSAALAPAPLTFRDSIAAAAYDEAGIGADDLSVAEVYDLSSALELDWYENIGLCKAGEAETPDQRRRHHARRQGRDREPERWPRLLRRGRPCPGHRPGVRDRLATPRTSGRSSGRRRHRRRHRQPGPVRPRLVGRPFHLTRPNSGEKRVPGHPFPPNIRVVGVTGAGWRR